MASDCHRRAVIDLYTTIIRAESQLTQIDHDHGDAAVADGRGGLGPRSRQLAEIGLALDAARRGLADYQRQHLPERIVRLAARGAQAGDLAEAEAIDRAMSYGEQSI